MLFHTDRTPSSLFLQASTYQNHRYIFRRFTFCSPHRNGTLPNARQAHQVQRRSCRCWWRYYPPRSPIYSRNQTKHFFIFFAGPTTYCIEIEEAATKPFCDVVTQCILQARHPGLRLRIQGTHLLATSNYPDPRSITPPPPLLPTPPMTANGKELRIVW
jgi:hypothetical protein